MKSKLVLSAEEARLEPTAIMGNESGIISVKWPWG